MDNKKLKLATQTKQDIIDLESLISDLNHINKPNIHPHNPSKNKVISTLKKLFYSTTIKIEKDNIKVDPISINHTDFCPFAFRDEGLIIELGNLRSDVLELMIVRLQELKIKQEESFKNL